MSDIVERLRSYARNCGGPPEEYLTWQAADEIERLRETRMHAFLAATTWRHQAFLRAENGDIFRVWFAGNDDPHIERLVLPRDGEYSEPVAALAKAEEKSDVI